MPLRCCWTQALLGLLAGTACAVGDVSYTLTAQYTADRLTPQPPLQWQQHQIHLPRSGTLNATTLQVDTNQTYQTIEGFGGAFTDSAAFNFESMNASLQDELVELYWGATGLRYSMGRLTIGSCDFSLEYYNYDDRKDDLNLTQFNISHDKQRIIPFIHRALAATNGTGIKMVASPWSAPAWMKKNGKMNCDLGPWTCVLKDSNNGAYKQAWANYIVKYIEAYKAASVPIWGMTVQNEPEAQTGNLVYEGMHFTPDSEKQFIVDHLGPMMAAHHPDVNLLIYDHNKDHIVEWVKEILGDPEASKYVWGTAFHWYTGPYFENLAAAHELFPNKPLLSTEATVAKQKAGTYDEPIWSSGEHYGREILGDLNNWSVGFIDWNLLLDSFGGPLHADPTGGMCEKLVKCGSDAMVILQNGKLEKQAFYYYMGHVSRFIPPGSVRIGATVTGDSILATVARTPSGNIVVVAMNEWDGPSSFTLIDPRHGKVQTSLPPHSIATFVYA